ncbi:unnamed protein product, partial [Aphanomyces euteiches]
VFKLTMAQRTDDVVQDLHLLFATDDQLHKDLAYICSLLDSPERSMKSKRERPKTTSQEFAHMDRRKRQILQLRRQVDTLKDTLLQAQQIVTGKPDMSTWERAAREQMLAYNKSLSDNEKLRAHVEENATFIEEMVSTLRKKPRLSLDVDSEEWRTYKLAAQANLRNAAIHAIADHQYNQLQTAFIKAGIFECRDEVIQNGLINLPDGRLMPQRTYHVTIAAPFRLIGAAVWKVFNGEHPLRLPEGAEETLEKVDPYTVYQSFRNLDRDDQVHANNVFKYYVEVNREVIVWRSVLEDALMPRMRDDVVQNKWGWIVVSPTDDPETSRLSFLHQVEPELNPCDAKNALNQKYTFALPPEIPGTFPGGNVKEEIEFPVVPVKKWFYERDMELERTLKHVIDNVVFEHHKMSPSTE